ncbi:MAG: two-component system, response regulator YesN [Clostridiales bacterium]|jgi:YesN/AraC family two-component response regulator|nr:two-component system, response regulator YesN [Clostridiales bacterium]MDK2933217.1 two-component system, response regulator YesN [Clostridiales bacterium]
MKKRYISNYKFNSVFVKTFIILILSTIIPILAANAIIYKQSTSTFQRQICNTNMNMLEKTSETVDLIFKQADQTIQQLANDRSIINFIINPDINLTTRNSKIIGDLKNLSRIDNHIHSIYIYSTYNDTILSSSGDAYKLIDFKDKEWLSAYNHFVLGTYQLETRKISDAPEGQLNCITLIRNLPYDSSSKLGAIVININEEKLYQTISGSGIKPEGEIYVINGHGDILSHKNKEKLYTNLSHYSYIQKVLQNHKGFFIEKVGRKRILFTYVTSSYNNWKYIYSIPLEALQDDSRIISRIIVIITLIYILLGLIISFLISKGIYHPIEELMNLVLTTSKNMFNFSHVKNEYEFLGYAYNDVIDKNKNMEKTIDNIKPIMKEKLFTNLIMGKIDNAQEICEKLDFLNINFSLTNFIVIAVQIDGYSEFLNQYNEKDRNLYKIKLLNMIENIISDGQKGVCIEIESDKMAAIINFTDNITLVHAKEKSLAIAANIKDEVEKHFPFTITLGIGRMYKNIINIKLSYNEAVNALKYKLYQGKNKVIDIDDIELQPEELYYYDSEKEKLLINNIRVGQQKEVDVLIDELVQEILDSRTTSYTYIQQVFTRVISSIIELIINMGMTVDEVFGPECNLYETLSSKETIEDIKIWLSEICHTTICAINKVNLTKSQKNAEKILEYIDKNLNHDISINDIAEWIGFSPAYVSKVFKEHIGKNYIDYLNGSRIEKAKQLLKNTRLPVKEVGFRVGFNNIQTFMRTFKKYEGITPGQYRNKM